MLRRFTFVVGFAAGYVLGARAGRRRYEQIASGARRLWRSDPVQVAAHQAEDLLKEKAHQAQHVVQDKIGGGSSGAEYDGRPG